MADYPRCGHSDVLRRALGVSVGEKTVGDDRCRQSFAGKGLANRSRIAAISLQKCTSMNENYEWGMLAIRRQIEVEAMRVGAIALVREIRYALHGSRGGESRGQQHCCKNESERLH